MWGRNRKARFYGRTAVMSRPHESGTKRAGHKFRALGVWLRPEQNLVPILNPERVRFRRSFFAESVPLGFRWLQVQLEGL